MNADLPDALNRWKKNERVLAHVYGGVLQRWSSSRRSTQRYDGSAAEEVARGLEGRRDLVNSIRIDARDRSDRCNAAFLTVFLDECHGEYCSKRQLGVDRIPGRDRLLSYRWRGRIGGELDLHCVGVRSRGWRRRRRPAVRWRWH